MFLSQTTTAQRVDALAKWAHIHAVVPVDYYRIEDAGHDFITVWPELDHLPSSQFVTALIRQMAETIDGTDGTEQEGHEKLLGVLTAYYYRPRPPRGAWSPERDAAEGVPVSVLGKGYYRA